MNPSDLIEMFEQETGSRIDDASSPALAGLFGFLARAMGKSAHDERDDVVAGYLIQDEIENGESRRQTDELILGMLLSGVSPDDLGALFGK